MFHFGKGGKVNEDAKIIQFDICYEQLHSNRKSDIVLLGDIKHTINLLNNKLISMSIMNKEFNFKLSFSDNWWKELKQNIENNKKSLEKKCNEITNPMNYYYVLKKIQEGLPNDVIIISEGASTLDM